MERITKIMHKGKEITLVDYSNVKKDDEMIEIIRRHKKMILSEKKKHLFAADYVGSFTTPKYVAEAHRFLEETKLYIEKGAFLGVTGTKNLILQGVIRIFKLNFKIFTDKTAAFDFLAE